MTKDIGNKCIYCFEDTSFGSGRFVNRIPADDGEHEGYACSECQYYPEDDIEKVKEHQKENK